MSWWTSIERKLDLLLSNQENIIMPTLADIAAADAQMKAELDAITTGVTNLNASNAKMAADLAAAIASNDPAALQAALDAANANVAEGQAIVTKLPASAP